MIKFKRSSCAVLPLVLERVWFEKIRSGEKYEEYRCGARMMRMIQRWWGEAKIEHKKAIVEFRLGYQRDAERLACVAEHVSLRADGEFIHPDLGEPTDRKHYAILLTGSVELINDEWRARTAPTGTPPALTREKVR